MMKMMRPVLHGTATGAIRSISKKTRLQDCLGVRVFYDPDFEQASITLDFKRWWWPWRTRLYPGICESRGLGRFACVVMGPALLNFPPREQQALLLHEIGHVKMKHVRERIFSAWKIVFCPAAFSRLCVRQEYQADGFALGCGYGADLARAFARVTEVKSALHPSREERIARLVS